MWPSCSDLRLGHVSQTIWLKRTTSSYEKEKHFFRDDPLTGNVLRRRLTGTDDDGVTYRLGAGTSCIGASLTSPGRRTDAARLVDGSTPRTALQLAFHFALDCRCCSDGCACCMTHQPTHSTSSALFLCQPLKILLPSKSSDD